MSATILVKYHSEHSKPIEAAHSGEWIDLKTAENVRMIAGDFKLISLGVSIKVPAGYEAVVAPRSSTFKVYGLLQANSIGVIDNLYCGNDDVWRWPAYATRHCIISAGSRLCQFRIQKIQPELKIEEADDLGNINRGGFGSTGK